MSSWCGEEALFNLQQLSECPPMQIHTGSYKKYTHSIATSLKVLVHSGINSKPKISYKYNQLKNSQVSSSNSAMDGTMEMVQPGAKFLSTCGLVKVEN